MLSAAKSGSGSLCRYDLTPLADRIGPWNAKTILQMSRIVRKPDVCLCENKGADQLRGNREADQRLCFRYTDSTNSLLLKSEISSF